MNEHLWTLEQAIEVAREIEKAALAIGYHVALGGSVMYRGYSDKDLEFADFTPHKTTDAHISMGELQSLLPLTDWIRCGHEFYGDDKVVWNCLYKGKSVDVFFVK